MLPKALNDPFRLLEAVPLSLNRLTGSPDPPFPLRVAEASTWGSSLTTLTEVFSASICAGCLGGFGFRFVGLGGLEILAFGPGWGEVLSLLRSVKGLLLSGNGGFPDPTLNPKPPQPISPKP